tara:strand:+ start:15152 stop:15997 length:846 start_codon:yes stop_codon:yes gene_type:complete
MTKILISGENGFVGSNLKDHLEKKYKIISFPKRLDRSNNQFLREFETSDILIHCAASTNIGNSWNSFDELLQSNIESTKCVIDYCIKNNTFLIFISSYLYGNTKILPTPETEKIRVNNPYALSKKICEEMCIFYQKNLGLKLTIVRPFNIYGYSTTKQCLVMSIINQIKNNHKITIKDLKPRRDLIYIKDFSEFIEKIIEKNLYSEILNAGSGVNHSISEIIDMIQSFHSKKYPVENFNDERQNEIFETLADISKAKKLLNWAPKWKFREGIKDMIEISSK